MVTNPLQTVIINRGIVSDGIIPKTEKDDFTQSSIVLNNGTHANGISSQHKGSVLSQSMDDDSSRSPSLSPIKGSSRSLRRKAEDGLMSEQPPLKKNGQKSKSEMTDEEKRRNFLERNRQGDLNIFVTFIIFLFFLIIFIYNYDFINIYL
jgi:hypothetical protein